MLSIVTGSAVDWVEGRTLADERDSKASLIMRQIREIVPVSLIWIVKVCMRAQLKLRHFKVLSVGSI